jgi:hypothetical protein
MEATPAPALLSAELESVPARVAVGGGYIPPRKAATNAAWMPAKSLLRHFSEQPVCEEREKRRI